MSNEQWALLAILAFAYWKFGTQDKATASAATSGAGNAAPAATVPPTSAGWADIKLTL
ncbi:hypothetical protein [uncultured Aquitalea sp.]|uniref:hypothetical protein n=1 Tax=uncultured Aquitalea sp. TaxID=540272 RepID=UPI0025E500C0|nr:hypothetical protein [uncultured Aquitalea sp.]